jgi:GTP-binding protein HflX
LLSDTVGFIRDLPHRLIASFKATLEETRQADLLLHVADASSPSVQDQISAVFNVLQELGIEEKDTLLVLNKVDRVPAEHTLTGLLRRYPNGIAISAKTGLGFEKLASVVGDTLSRSFRNVNVEMRVNNGRLLAYLAAHGEILSTKYSEERVDVHCRIPQKYLGRILSEDVTITINDDEQTGRVGDAAGNEAKSLNDSASLPIEEVA